MQYPCASFANTQAVLCSAEGLMMLVILQKSRWSMVKLCLGGRRRRSWMQAKQQLGCVRQAL